MYLIELILANDCMYIFSISDEDDDEDDDEDEDDWED